MPFVPFAHGGVAYPLTADTTNSLLEDADPSLFHALAHVADAIEYYVGARLLAQAALESFNFPSAVAQRIHVDPVPLLADQLVFPTLAIVRKGEAFGYVGAGVDRDVSEWEVAYVLPPLSPKQRKALEPALRAVAVVIRKAFETWTPDGVERARAVSVRYGGYEPVQEVSSLYRAVFGTVQVSEIASSEAVADAYPLYDGEDAHIDHVDEVLGTHVDLVEFATGPRIVSVTPGTGTSAGGTTVTITGVNFGAGTTVLFGATPATGVSVLNDITLQCTTPAGTGAVAVKVTDAGGRSDTMTNGFTYT